MKDIIKFFYRMQVALPFIRPLLIGICVFIALLTSKLRFMPQAWYLTKLNYLSLLGANRIDEAKSALKKMETAHFKGNNDNEIRFLYQCLATQSLYQYDLEPCIDVFDTYVSKYPNALWAWRILIDYTYYLGNEAQLENVHKRYLAIRDAHAKKLGECSSERQYFGTFFTYLIGHTCFLSWYVKRSILENSNTKKNVLYVDPTRVANYHLLTYFFPFFEVLMADQQPRLSEEQILRLEDPFCARIRVSDKYLYAHDAQYALQSKWEAGGHTALLTLRPEDDSYGRSQLEKVGISGQAWFVTLHVREAFGNSVRNAKIESYILAIKEVTKRGGWVIRIGDKSMSKLPTMPNVFDYAHSELKNDRLDVYLFSACKFFMGTVSGPLNAPGLFGVPCIQTNLIPLRHNLPNINDLTLPVLFKSRADGTLWNFSKMLSGAEINSEILTMANKTIELVYNTPEILRDAVHEFLETHNSVDSDQLTHKQKVFAEMCAQMGVSFRPKVADSFLEKYSHLLA